ncbi:MAG: response regulator [Chthoniobacterales bacterium]
MKKILIVEDNETTALTLGRLLKHRGYEVKAAADAIGALECALRFEPDLVILDISIPGGNGFTVAEKIQKLVPRPVHLFFLTGGTGPGLQERAGALGAVDFFQKPCPTTELLERIQDTLEGRLRDSRKEVYVL